MTFSSFSVPYWQLRCLQKNTQIFILTKLMPIVIIAYEQVKSGTSCNLITSSEECTRAALELGLSHTPKGTVPQNIDTYGPSGCYLRFNGELWYNANEQSPAPCTSESTCICRTGKLKLKELNLRLLY